MRMKIQLIAFLFAMLLCPFQTSFPQPNPSLAGMNANERKVIEYLLNDWRQDYSLTGVDIAMEALGFPQSDAMRFRIGSHIKKHPELHEVVRQWGWQTLALTPSSSRIR